MPTITPPAIPLLITSHCNGAGPALYSATFDPASGILGNLTPIESPLKSAFFLTINADSNRIYVADFVKEYAGRPGGAIHAFALNAGNLIHASARPAADTAPCYLSVSGDQNSLFSAGYGSGHVTRFELSPATPLSDAASAITPATPTHPAMPRAHCTLPPPDGRFLLTTFLGLDTITVHACPPGPADLILVDTLALPTKSSPRHLAWHPSGKLFLVITEKSNHVFSIGFDPQTGKLTLLDSQPSLPPDFTGTSAGADIQVHPSGFYVYASNRGHQSIAAFRLSPQTGKLSLLGHFPSGGDFPQCLRFDPTGAFLLCANMKSNRITTHRVDLQSGALAAINEHLTIPSPSCMLFLP
jgi:6-phosphogluconolactonase